MTTSDTQPLLAEKLDEVLEGTSTSYVITIPLESRLIEFKIKKTTDGDMRSIVAYTTKLENLELPVYDAIALFSPDLANLLPAPIKTQKIRWKQLIIVYSKEKKKEEVTKKYLFLLDIGLSDPFAFADLPLIGDAFEETSIAEISFLPSLRLIAASKPFTLKETRYYNNNVLKDKEEDKDDKNDKEEEEEEEYSSIEKLPDPGEGKGKDTDIMIRKGVSISGKIEADRLDYFFNLPVTSEELGGAIANAPDNDSASVGLYGLWFELDQSLAFVSLKKIGVVYDSKENTLSILFDASIEVGPFTLSVNNMGVQLGFADNFKANFHIEGAGVVYITEKIKLAGALLYKEKNLNDIAYKEYIGLAAVKIKLSSKDSEGNKKSFGFSVIGSYAYYNRKPALFFYACLDYALGGPGFCFVTGFSFGLGYNRFLRVPEIDGVSEFPLVAQAISGGTHRKVEDISQEITEQLEGLDDYVTLSPGSGFIAMGLKFTSYKLVDSFALLTIAIGEDLEINALGIASMKVPPDVPGVKPKGQPLAKLTMLLKTRFSLDDMVISIEAQISNDSYILSKKCVLSGGFAFYLWFGGAHAGDFVISLGGYNPAFNKPAHYPNVPRLGFLWQVDKTMYLKGEMYFTLCSHALMAGGKQEASFRAGSLWAYFIAEFHFLISWKPYFYDIFLRVRIEAAIGCVGPACLGIKLHLWGPDFGGTATFKIIFVSVTMSFGNQDHGYPSPIEWNEFKESFFPSDPEVCTAVITDGVTRQLWQDNGSPLFIVNSEEFVLVTDSVIPTKKAFYNDKDNILPTDQSNRSFGVPSMGIHDCDLTTAQKIKITRGKDTPVDSKEWNFEPLTKKIPTGMWGEARVMTKKSKEYLLPPEANDEMFLDDTLCGYRITPGGADKIGKKTEVSANMLKHDTNLIKKAYAWHPIPAFAASSETDDVRTTTIKDTITNTSVSDIRKSLLSSLGFNPDQDVQLTDSVANDFVIAPLVSKR